MTEPLTYVLHMLAHQSILLLNCEPFKYKDGCISIRMYLCLSAMNHLSTVNLLVMDMAESEYICKLFL